jgi:transposase
MSAKTDKADARCIALYLARMKPAPGASIPDAFETLKNATRSRRNMIETRTTFKNRMHKLLRYNFPGYRRIVGKALSASLLHALCRHPSPDQLLAQSVEELASIAVGPCRTVGPKLAEKLHELARQVPDTALHKVTQIEIRMTARQILDLTDHIAELDAAIEELCDELFPDQQLTSIPGIGKVSAAAILAEVGDIARFPSKEKFVGYCGLYPVVWESGQVKRRYQMARKGNRMLKLTLLLASGSARLYNPAISDFYQRLRQRGKSVKAAGGAAARKLAHFVYVILGASPLGKTGPRLLAKTDPPRKMRSTAR